MPLFALFAALFLFQAVKSDICELEDLTRTNISAFHVTKAVEKLVHEHAGGSWLQIGANTMDKELSENNPIMIALDHVPHWQKYFVEPVPHTYEKLVENAKKWPNTTTIQYALSGNGGSYEGLASIYCIEGYHLEDHLHHHKHLNVNGKAKIQTHSAHELCSFDNKHVLKHFPGKKVVTVQIQAVSMSTLVRMFGIEDVRILLMDTEGFDAAVIMALPFERLHPPLIVYEHAHLTVEDRKQADAHLMKHCYQLYHDKDSGDNTFAVHRSYVKLIST